jgi:hypothetical protein
MEQRQLNRQVAEQEQRQAGAQSQPALNQKLRASRANRKIQLNARNRSSRLRPASGIQCAFTQNH